MLIEPEALQFGRFTLDRRRRRLLSGDKPLPVQDKVFDLLEYFVLHAGEELRRDDIIAHVWSGRTVSEGSLSVQLSALRKLLEKAGSTEPLILTLPNQRYRFVGEVSSPTPVIDPPPESPQFPPAPLPPKQPTKRQRWIAAVLAAGAGLAVLAFVLWRRPPSGLPPSGLSLVVLPFENRSTDRTQDILADNITDDLTNDLSHIPASTVIARESAEAVRGKTPQEIGAELHVRYVIEGAISPADTGYHVNVRVIEAATGRMAGPGVAFDEPRERESGLRDAIVHSIASKLHLKLDALESSRSLHDRPDNPSAIDLFFQARALLDGSDDSGALHRAQELLEAAIAKQNDFADAKADLGWLLLRKVLTDQDDEEDEDWLRANKIIEEALHLAPQDSLAIAAKARELLIEGKYLDAAAAAANALNIEPSSVEARWVLVNCAWMSGQLDAELSYLQAIHRLNPEGAQDKRVRYLEGIINLLQSHAADSIQLLLGSIGGEPEPVPGSNSHGRAEQARVWLVAAYALNHELDKARERLREYDKVWPHRSVWRFGAYLPRRIMLLPAAADVLQALRNAGMPQVADPNQTVLAPGEPCGDDPFAPTPLGLPKGGKTIDASGVSTLLNEPIPPVVIDLGAGSATVPSSHWFDPAGPAETVLQFVDRTVAGLGNADPSTPIIVMADGPYGCSAYQAALHLILNGFHNVEWFRGGEEEWANSGYRRDDRRPG